MEYVYKSEFDTINEQLCTCVSSLIIVTLYIYIDI